MASTRLASDSRTQPSALLREEEGLEQSSGQLVDSLGREGWAEQPAQPAHTAHVWCWCARSLTEVGVDATTCVGPLKPPAPPEPPSTLLGGSGAVLF